MNKIILAGALLPLLLLVAPEAFADSSYQHYINGWNAGQDQATSDWQAGYTTPNQNCPGHHHTSEYCRGYFNGYGDLWNRSIQANGNTDQQQTSNVNIKGNNNDVTVQQGQASNVPSGSGSSGDNPRCVLLCGSVNVN